MSDVRVRTRDELPTSEVVVWEGYDLDGQVVSLVRVPGGFDRYVLRTQSPDSGEVTRFDVEVSRTNLLELADKIRFEVTHW